MKPVFAARWRIFFFGLKHVILAGWYANKNPERREAHLLLVENAAALLKHLNNQ